MGRLQGITPGRCTSLVLLLHVFISWQAAMAACQTFSDVITTGGYGVADQEGRITSSCNPDIPFIPASLIKIPTAMAALHILGPDFRFKTEFYIDDQQNLFIKGYGDPLLISEEVELALRAVQRQGVQRINGLFVDTSSFALNTQVPGRESSHNPYDAPVGPASVNFNSIAVRIDKTGVHSDEPQMPDIPLLQEVARNRKPGQYRINICQGSCDPEEQMARYTTELFRAKQKEIGISGSGPLGRRITPSGATLIYIHHNSKNLEEVSGAMLQYSSNFIANLVYLACGAESYGYPATWDKGKRAIEAELIRRLGVDTTALIIHQEGAGLSRENRMTVRAMLEVLRVFRPHASLLPKKRGVYAKTGTMQGIYNYAGYLDNEQPFVILLNQERNTRSTVLDRLKKGL